MSLITIRSSTQDNGANVHESAAYMTNNFKKGIKLNMLELVSMSINKLDKFEIIQGENDQFVWRIGFFGATACYRLFFILNYSKITVFCLWLLVAVAFSSSSHRNHSNRNA